MPKKKIIKKSHKKSLAHAHHYTPLHQLAWKHFRRMFILVLPVWILAGVLIGVSAYTKDGNQTVLGTTIKKTTLTLTPTPGAMGAHINISGYKTQCVYGINSRFVTFTIAYGYGPFQLQYGVASGSGNLGKPYYYNSQSTKSSVTVTMSNACITGKNPTCKGYAAIRSYYPYDKFIQNGTFSLACGASGTLTYDLPTSALTPKPTPRLTTPRRGWLPF